MRGTRSRAKKIEAERKISLASRRRWGHLPRSGGVSAFSALISSASALLRPGLAPASTWAWSTQRCRLARETPRRSLGYARCTQRGVVTLMIEDHPHRSVLDLGRVLLGHDRYPDSSESSIKAVTLHVAEIRKWVV